MNVRLIPRLDIKGPNLVKGIHQEGLRVLGKPEAFARYYYENGADELFYMDAVASLYGRNSLLEIVSRTSREIFVPLTVGGGLRSVDDIRAVLQAGADKVALNTAALQRPELISEAARRFGSSTVVVAIDAVRLPNGSYEALVDYGRERTGVNPLEWAVRACELGAGELVLTSIDRDGTGQGFDTELIRKVAGSVPVPVIAGGGAGRVEHVLSALTRGAADAVSMGSLLHYAAIREQALQGGDYAGEGNVEFLKRGGGSALMRGASLQELRAFLTESGVACRA